MADQSLTEGHTHTTGQKQTLQYRVLGEVDWHTHKMNLYQQLTWRTRINSKWIKDSNVSRDNTQVLQGAPPGAAGHVWSRTAKNSAQHKVVSLRKAFCCSSGFLSVCVFSVWAKTTLLLPARPRDATRLGGPGGGHGQ